MCEHNRFHREEVPKIGCHQSFCDLENSSPTQTTDLKNLRQRRLGQVVVEYVLLLILAVAIASTAIKGCVKRSEDDAGTVIVFWDVILKQIGKDLADEPN